MTPSHNIFEHNIVIKRYFYLQNIVVTFLNIFKLGFNKHNCLKINMFKFTLGKNIG